MSEGKRTPQCYSKLVCLVPASPDISVIPATFNIPITLSIFSQPKDYRVAYWEVAKYAQRVREANTGPHDILFKCEMVEGHTGKNQESLRIQTDRIIYISLYHEYSWLMGYLSQASLAFVLVVSRAPDIFTPKLSQFNPKFEFRAQN
jgi:hypothetical protein